MTDQSNIKLNTDIKISIIMPVYKVEAYIGKAIESIQAQCDAAEKPFSDWELIAVDDGSPDQSGEICEAYAKEDKRITVLHQENGGAPKARNNAIPLAKGKYLFFMDSDDWCEPTMLSDLYRKAEDTHAQLVISGFYIDTYYDLKKGKYLTADYVPRDAVYETKEEFRKEAYKLFDKNMLYPPWNKLYLRSYIVENNLFFPQTFWDDFPFVLSVIKDIERVAVTSKQYYHFLRARTESETSKYVPKMYEKREEEHGWMVDLYRYWTLWEVSINEEKHASTADGTNAESAGNYAASLQSGDRFESIMRNREMVSRRYIDRLIGCFENLTNPKCELTKTEKRQTVKQMLQKDTVAEALKAAKPKSLYAKLMYLPVQWKCVPLVLLEAKTITWVKKHNMKLFAVLKSKR